MLEKSTGFLFYLKKPKNYTEGVLPIYLRITVSGECKELSIKRICEPSRWNQDAGRASGTKEEARQLNNHLDTIYLKAQEAKRILIADNKHVTALAIKNILTGKAEEWKSIIGVFKEHNARMEKLVGSEFSPRTLQRYETTLTHTVSFIKWKFKKPDVDIRQLNYEFINDFAFWLKSIRKCNHNSSMKYLANLKKIVLHCVRTKWLPGDPFENFKMTNREVIKEVLTADELDRIKAKEFISQRLSQVRDVFLFSCYTGLAYADISNLRKQDIKKGIDDMDWIFIYRQKTETPSRIPLLPFALELLSKYQNHPKCCNADKAFPVLSNQKMNEYIKEIGNLCGIKKKLSCHTARHTFATTVTLSNGVPIETVADMLGHKSLKQTQHYAKLLDQRISNDMAALRDKLNRAENKSTNKETSLPESKKTIRNTTVSYSYVIKN
jgi:site-specific recombinase XerD